MRRAGVLLLLWAGAIFVSSSIPGSSFPDVEIVNADKVVHFMVFFVLAVLLDRFLRLQTAAPFLATHHLLFTILITTLYGASDEFHQSSVPGRNPSLLDLAVDSGGALAYAVLFRLRHRRRSAGV